MKARGRSKPRTTDLRPWLWDNAPRGSSEHSPRSNCTGWGTRRSLIAELERGSSPHLRTGLSVVRGKNQKLIGVISDTHGLVRPEALSALEGADLIIHAGDIGKPEVVGALRSIAKVIAIRGNNDRGAWARKFPETAVCQISRVKIFVVHDVKELDLDPGIAGLRVVISGHSHSPSMVERDGVLFLNPGSAGPRRFKLPVSVAQLRVTGSTVDARILKLNPVAAAERFP